MRGDRGVVGLQPRRKKPHSPARHILFEGYISHTSNLARWARKQEMKMMYIMVSAGSNSHIRALYQTKLLYHYKNSQSSEQRPEAGGGAFVANVRA